MRRKLTPAYDLVIVGSGVAGPLRSALRRGRSPRPDRLEGAGADLVELARAGRHRRCDCGRRRAGAARRGHARRRARPLPRERRAGADGRGAGAHRRSRRPRRPLRRRARARGRPLAAARPQRRRRADGTRDLPGARARRARASAHRRQRARACARAVDVRTDAASGSSPTRARSSARAVLLATGGYAALWGRTTNPAGSVGEGIAMAFRAGAAVADLEFVQFHPTALAGSSLLLSEALRGDGALLVDEHGDRFVEELAPRDVVARAIDARRHGAARPAAGRPLALPGADGADRRRRLPSRVGARPGRAGGALHDGRRRDGSRRRDRGARPLRGRRVRVHRRARREPARVELDARVPRLRPPRRARRVSTSHVPGSDPGTCPVRTRRARDAGAARGALGGRRPAPQRRRARAARRRRRTCSRRSSRAARSRARRAAAVTSASTFPTENPALDGLHTVLRPGREPELEPWS